MIVDLDGLTLTLTLTLTLILTLTLALTLALTSSRACPRRPNPHPHPHPNPKATCMHSQAATSWLWECMHVAFVPEMICPSQQHKRARQAHTCSPPHAPCCPRGSRLEAGRGGPGHG